MAPPLFRSMLHVDGKPVVGEERCQLGVRVGVDVQPDALGRVAPGKRRGLSVAPSWRSLPFTLIPKRLLAVDPRCGGRAEEDFQCFRLGDGPRNNRFSLAPGGADRLTDDLQFTAGRPSHGVIEPSRSMALEKFQAALADTRSAWIVDEE